MKHNEKRQTPANDKISDDRSNSSASKKEADHSKKAKTPSEDSKNNLEAWRRYHRGYEGL